MHLIGLGTLGASPEFLFLKMVFIAGEMIFYIPPGLILSFLTLYMKKVCTLFFLLGWLITVSFAQESVSEESLSRADSLYSHFHEEQALEAYNNILNQAPQNYTALWRASFLYSRIGNRFESEERKREYFNRGIELAQKALNVDSTDTQSNFVMSVAMGRKALISGAKERVAASREIKRYAERAIRLDSTNAGAWHVLGRWHFKVANLNFLERLAANTLFGGIPKASEVRAAETIEKAIELNPNYILYHYDLARVYRSIGRDDRAVASCRKALGLELLTTDDPRLQKECKMLIRDLH